MKTKAEMRGRLKVISDELGAVAAKNPSDWTADEIADIDRLTAEFNELAPELEKLDNLEKTAKRARELAGIGSGGQSTGRTVANGDAYGEVELGTGEESEPDFYASVEALAKDYLKGGARGKSDPVAVGSLLAIRESFVHGGGVLNRRQLAEIAKNGGRDLYTLIRSGGQPAELIPTQRLPQIYRPIDADRTLRRFLINGRTTSDSITFIRELLYTNNAAEVAEATTFDVTALGSSGRKPESALTFEQDTANVVTIAHWVPITRQVLADFAQLRTYIDDRLLVGLEQRLNGQALNGAGGGTDMTGILNTTGIQTLDDAYFATPGNETKNAGGDLEPFDRIARARTLIRTVGKARPSFVLLNPADLEVLMTTTDATDRYMAGGPFSSGGVTSLWGLPVGEEEELDEGTALVGDGTAAAIWDREEGNILIDTINDQFVRNMITVLAELRAALTVFRPAAFAEVELGTVA